MQDRNRLDDERFIVKFDAWEGPIEALLDLAKSQKLDLLQINILQLIEQFEELIHTAQELRIELAADWLVMASWLIYLKSKILLKSPKKQDNEEMSEDILAFHLKRIEAVRLAADKVQDRNILGRDWFSANVNTSKNENNGIMTKSFHMFLSSYPRPKKEFVREIRILKPFDLDSVDNAIARLKKDVNNTKNWTKLIDYVPFSEGLRLRSNISTSFIGMLELTRKGVIEIKQDGLEEPIYIRRCDVRY